MSDAVSLALDVVGYVLATAGVAFIAIGALGLVRFPDAYSRLSAVTKAATLGVCLVLLGVLALEPSWPVAVTVLVAVALQLGTSPVGGYALGRAAYRSGSPLAPSSQYDELAGRSASARTPRDAAATGTAGTSENATGTAGTSGNGTGTGGTSGNGTGAAGTRGGGGSGASGGAAGSGGRHSPTTGSGADTAGTASIP